MTAIASCLGQRGSDGTALEAAHFEMTALWTGCGWMYEEGYTRSGGLGGWRDEVGVTTRWKGELLRGGYNVREEAGKPRRDPGRHDRYVPRIW